MQGLRELSYSVHSDGNPLPALLPEPHLAFPQLQRLVVSPVADGDSDPAAWVARLSLLTGLQSLSLEEQVGWGLAAPAGPSLTRLELLAAAAITLPLGQLPALAAAKLVTHARDSHVCISGGLPAGSPLRALEVWAAKLSLDLGAVPYLEEAVLGGIRCWEGAASAAAAAPLRRLQLWMLSTQLMDQLLGALPLQVGLATWRWDSSGTRQAGRCVLLAPPS